MAMGMNILAATLASAALIYLLFAIVRPERF